MTNINIDISNPLLYANQNFASLITNRDRYIVSYGGRDAGKSYNIAQKIIYNLLCETYCKVVLLRKVYSDIRDSQFQTILDVIEDWKLSQYFHYTYNPMKIICTLNDNVILSRGLDKPAKLKSIKDPTLVWVEEANEIKYQDFMNTNMSIRSNIPNPLLQMILTFNPENERTWINQYFFPPSASYQEEDGEFDFITSTKKDATILHSSYRENRYCSKQNRETYKNLKSIDLDYYNVSILGLWGSFDQAMVFDNVYYVDSFPTVEERKSYSIGLDFGFTNDPTAAVECCIAHGEIYVRELFYRKGLVNTTEVSDRLSIDKEFQRVGILNQEIFADSAEPKSIEELRLKGYNIRGVAKGKGSVESGITSLKAYKINVVKSPNIKKEFSNYRYKKDINGEITNTPIDAFNHAIDAVRYWYKGAVDSYTELVFDII